MQAAAGPVISLSPSFNSYSNRKLAARISDEFHFERQGLSDADEEEEEFEFAFVARDSELSSPVPADAIFQNGKIRPVYPAFNRRDLVVVGRGENLRVGKEKENDIRVSSKGPKIRLPLRKLFSEERETTMTSSETDELDGVAVETYCVWQPEGQCKKSSFGARNSKRWKLKDLLHGNSSRKT